MKKFFFYLFMLSFSFFICFILFAIFALLTYKDPDPGRKITITPNTQYYTLDEDLGYRAMKGSFEVKIQVKELPEPKIYKLNIDENGHRFTSKNANDHTGQPEIWIHGCSFTWGQGLNDEETYPYIVQSKLKNHKVINFGENGYGNHHALIQIEKELAKATKFPEAIVVSYIDWHSHRNVGESSYISALEDFQHFKKGILRKTFEKLISTVTKFMKVKTSILEYKYKYPVASIGDNNTLKIEAIPLVAFFETAKSSEYTWNVTKKIFLRILDITKDKKIPVIILHQWSSLPDYKTDPMIQFFKTNSFIYVDAYVDYSKNENNMNPYDGHPNSKSNEIFANALLQKLSELNIR
jgi:hypothetical protein